MRSEPLDRLVPDAVLRYADHVDGVIDVHLPADGPRPAALATRGSKVGESTVQHWRLNGPGVVVLLHGGFWKQEWDRTHTRELARDWADRGWVVTTPEYRRVGGGGGWPTTWDDVRTAITQLPELLRGQGAITDGLSMDGLTVVGHSAGGQLALLAAGLPQVTRVVALAPVADLRAAERLALGGGAVRAFLGPGTDPDAADPMVRLHEEYGVPVVVLHGDRDTEVPVGLSRTLVDRHPWIGLVELPVGHYELIDPADQVAGHVRGALGPDGAPPSTV